jgi:hypothetical protein
MKVGIVWELFGNCLGISWGIWWEEKRKTIKKNKKKCKNVF